MRRLIRLSSLLLSSGLALTAGCSNSTVIGGGADGGTGGDMATSGGGDMAITGQPDMAQAVAISGTRLQMGTWLLEGMTTDDFIVADDIVKKNISAVSIAGGAPKVIDAAAQSLAMHGNAVFTWDTVDKTSGAGVGNIWTSANGAKQLASASLAGEAKINAEGTYIFYTDGTASDGSTTDLYVAKVDGSGAHKITTGTDVTNACSPKGAFIAGNKLVLSHCESGNTPDGGVTGARLTVYDAATGMGTDLDSGLANWLDISKAGDKVFTADSGNGGLVYAIAGGKPTKIDSDVKDGFLLPDGSAVVYRTGAGALKRSAVSSPSPTALVMTGVNFLQRYQIGQEVYPAISSDGKYIIYSTNIDNMTGLSDLFLASTATAGMPVTLNPDQKGALFGDAFTTDGSRAIFYTMCVNVQAVGGLIGKVNTVATSGGAPVQNGKNVWVSYAGKGSTLVYDDNFKSAKYHGRGDLFSVDSAKMGAMSTTYAPQAEADFYLTTDKSKVAFAVNGVAAAGLYVAPIQ